MSSAPKTLTADECNQLLTTLLCAKGTQKQFHKGIRNYTIALLMLDAGLRVGETTCLEVGDLWFNNSPVTTLLVRPAIAKNHRERAIHVSPQLKQALENLHREYSWFKTTESNHKVFTIGLGSQQMTTRQFRRIISKAAIRSLGRSVHPHTLRHTFATNLMRVTNMRTVQELLGHSNIASTQIYTHPNADDKKKAIENMHRTDGQ
jgi:site-specific recombinase XerD